MRSEKPGSLSKTQFSEKYRDEIFDETYEEFFELKFNSTAKDNFKELELEAFLVKYLPVYPLISTHWHVVF